MKQVTLKPNKHLILIEMDAGVSEKTMDGILKEINERIPEFTVLISNRNTEITLIQLED